jgi:hypothetical protein
VSLRSSFADLLSGFTLLRRINDKLLNKWEFFIILMTLLCKFPDDSLTRRYFPAEKIVERCGLGVKKTGYGGTRLRRNMYAAMK